MPPIKTLLLTGKNNHDWRRSAPFCKDLLEKSGRFDVTLTEDPSAALVDPAALDGLQLIFTDYNGPIWSDAAKANFESAIKSGTGLVVLHAADNAFVDWYEYEKMVGLLWRAGTSHGDYHEFDVAIQDKTHPITRGMADYKQWDELYHKLVHMHSVPFRVLATAYSSPESRGTGNHEPVMVTTQYGKGRVYHHVLGHVWPGDADKHPTNSMRAFENPSFQRALLRGCEWAATGDVRD
ncbi:MAG: ThuA domain-containing protein [Planctomycetota bacterium]|nr:ThuA domain-containing protein [Planctomycetota bacterium]